MYLRDIMAKAERVVEKVWGREYWLVNTDDYCAKILVVAPKRRSSLHYHINKHETFLIVAGECRIELGYISEVQYKPQRLVAGDTVSLWPQRLHRFSTGRRSCTILEVSTHHDDADVVRIEPSRKL